MTDSVYSESKDTREGNTVESLSEWDQKIVNELKILAEDVEPVKHAKLAAAIAIRGNIIAFGNNSLRTHPFQARFGKNEFAAHWHAETHAIFNSLKRISVDELERATLYVVRVKRPDEHSRLWKFGMARPCRGCRKCIHDFGIPRVIYSTETGFTCESE